MNRRLRFCVLTFLMSIMSVVNAQELTVSDVNCRLVHNEKYYGNDEIVLYKDGSDLRVELSYFRCNPFVTGFDIVPNLKKGSNDAPDSVSVNVMSVVPDSYRDANVLQQWYHVSFTIHDVEANSLFFSCLWFEGQVNLTDGKYLMLNDPGVEVTVDNVVYRIYELKHFAALLNGKNTSGELTIPSELSYEGQKYPVKVIRSQAFRGCNAITSVTIPNSVLSVENEAFYGCNNLSFIKNGENVEMVLYNAFGGTPWLENQPNGVVYFGKTLCARKGDFPDGTDLVVKEGTVSITSTVFNFCKGLSSITIPEGVTCIEASTFMGCSDLVSVKMPESLTIIDNDAFRECDKMSTLHIPSCVRYICSSAFSNCASLTSFSIPEGVETIGESAFFGCRNMAAVTLPESLKKIDYEAFRDCKSLTSVVIPDNVKEVSEAAFVNCANLNSLTLSEKLEFIGASAFYGCSNLSAIVCNAQFPPAESPYMNKAGGLVSTDVFYNVDKQNCKLYVPKGCEDAYRASDLWEDFFIVEMGSGTTSISEELRVKSEESANAVYDLQGRWVNSKFKIHNSQLKHGIYILNGKKVTQASF